MPVQHREQDLVLRAVLLSIDRELVACLRETLFAVGGVELLGSVGSAQELLAWGRRQQPDLILVDLDRLGAEADVVTAAWRSEPAGALLIAVTNHPERLPPDVRTLARPPHPEAARELVARHSSAVRWGLGRGRSPATERDGDPGPHVRRLLVRSPGHLRLLPVEQILWIDAVHNAVKIHAEEGTFRLRQSIASLVAQLDPARFVRIHRSTVVQLEAVREFRVNARGQYSAVMPGGAKLTVSRSFHDGLLARLREA